MELAYFFMAVIAVCVIGIVYNLIAYRHDKIEAAK